MSTIKNLEFRAGKYGRPHWAKFTLVTFPLLRWERLRNWMGLGPVEEHVVAYATHMYDWRREGDHALLGPDLCLYLGEACTRWELRQQQQNHPENHPENPFSTIAKGGTRG